MTTGRIAPVELLLAAAAALLVVALVLRAGHGHGASVVADPVRTPGVVNPDVTQENIRSTICRRGWTSTVRPPVVYTNALKQRQMPAYGETGPLSAYQEDHLISLELGGDPTDPRNRVLQIQVLPPLLAIQAESSTVSGIAAHIAPVSLSVQDRSNGPETGVYWYSNWYSKRPLRGCFHVRR
jgi:hypothetical protein